MYNPGSGSGSKLGQTPRSGSGIQIQCIWIHNTGWNELKEYHSEFLLFHLRWSRSRTFNPAPAKMSRLRNTGHVYTSHTSPPLSSSLFLMELHQRFFVLLETYSIITFHRIRIRDGQILEPDPNSNNFNWDLQQW